MLWIKALIVLGLLVLIALLSGIIYKLVLSINKDFGEKP